MSDPVIGRFKDILRELKLSYEQLFLFGSRAGNNYRNDSDYDILIVLSGEILPEEERKLRIVLRKRLSAEYPLVHFDILLRGKEDFIDNRDTKNIVDYAAYHFGIAV
jgi:predicted nucleotidyltransferase